MLFITSLLQLFPSLLALFYSNVSHMHLFFFPFGWFVMHTASSAAWRQSGSAGSVHHCTLFFFFSFFLRPLNFSSNRHKIHSPLNLWQFKILHHSFRAGPVDLSSERMGRFCFFLLGECVRRDEGCVGQLWRPVALQGAYRAPYEVREPPETMRHEY